jgi:hypothetical protein
MALKINVGSQNITEYPVYQSTEPSLGNIRAKERVWSAFLFQISELSESIRVISLLPVLFKAQ